MIKNFLTASSVIALAHALAAPGASAQQASQGSAPALLETIDVDAARSGASSNPPTFEAQQRRFMRRPGAETVVSVTQQDQGPRGAMRDVLAETPGVYAPDRGAHASGMISMRGSDIAQTGPRGGRGVRAYLDGIPLGRTESGLTNQLIDLKAGDYLEIYRGANSLRYGAIVSGGALNLVSKTGRSAPGNAVSLAGGSYDHMQGQAESGGAYGGLDWYLMGSGSRNGGFQEHTIERTLRLTGNVGWTPAAGIETRTYVSAGSAEQELGGSLPLDQLKKLRSTATADALAFSERADFAYQRIANRTTFKTDSTAFEIGSYFLHTSFDHLPVPQSGIVDNDWRDYGLSGRVEHKSDVVGLPVEIVGGLRLNYEDADFKRWRHRNSGMSKASIVADWNFDSWLVESYGEAAVEVLPKFKVFGGLQAMFTNRNLEDVYAGPATIAAQFGNNPQPGRSAGRQEYYRNFDAVNPKLGANYEYDRNHFVFANMARSSEVPTGSDLSNLMAAQASSGRKLPGLAMQTAWTLEGGVRGGWERLEYDVTLYHMRLRNEILTRCATEISATNCNSQNQIAFNANRTEHNGIELGAKAVPVTDMLMTGDKLSLSLVYNFNDFRFDRDPTFGNARMPVIPRNQIYSELSWRAAEGFYVATNVRYLSERRTTFDGSGSGAFVVQPHALLGAKLGWRPPGGSWSLWLEGRNLTDVAYVGDLSAAPKAIGTTPSVNPGDGRAVYGGATVRF